MKKTDLKKYSVEDLRKEIAEKRDALRGFRFGSAGSRSRNTREGRTTRKEIARLLTELNARNAKPKIARSVALAPKKG